MSKGSVKWFLFEILSYTTLGLSVYAASHDFNVSFSVAYAVMLIRNKE